MSRLDDIVNAPSFFSFKVPMPGCGRADRNALLPRRPYVDAEQRYKYLRFIYIVAGNVYAPFMPFDYTVFIGSWHGSSGSR